jgi:hypothetical protein
VIAVRFSSGARQRLVIAVRFSSGGTPFGPYAVRCFFLPCASPWRTAKIVHRALSDMAHGNGTLPCKMLPCAVCRASRWKTHHKNFVVRFCAFAVRPGRTANPLFPVVEISQLFSHTVWCLC